MNNSDDNGMSFFRDSKQVRRAMGQAVQDALRTHKLLSQPVVTWRDGQVVWLPPEEIPLKSDTNGDTEPA